MKTTLLSSAATVLACFILHPVLLRAQHSAPADASGKASTSAVSRSVKQGVTALPEAEQRSINEQILAAMSWFTPREVDRGRGAGYSAVCAGQQMEIHADARGVALFLARTADEDLTRRTEPDLVMELAGAAVVAPREEQARVVYERGGGLEEWYLNTPAGLEQGFTVRERRGTAPLSLTLELRTALRAEQPRENGRITFREAASGAARLFYDDLIAWDAMGQRLPARMVLATDGRAIVLQVDDAGAQYPVTIDPRLFTQVAVVKDDAPSAGRGFGTTVAIAGTRLAVGTPAGGPVHVFSRTATGWALQFKIPQPATNGAGFGSVMDADETFVAIAAPGSDRVYLHSLSNGALSGTALPSVTDAAAIFGSSVALDVVNNDAFLAIGSLNETGLRAGAGAAYLFTKTFSGSLTQSERFFASDGFPGDQYGASVALVGSAIDALLAVGAPNRRAIAAAPPTGAVYVHFEGTEQRLTAPVALANGKFGAHLAMTGETFVGDERLAVADQQLASSAGRVQIYRNDGNAAAQSWVLEATLVHPSFVAGSLFGAALAMDGELLAVGAPQVTVLGRAGAGNVAVYARSGTAWTLRDSLAATQPEAGAGFGTALSLDGDYLAAGSPGATAETGLTGAGAVQIFHESGGAGAWTPQASQQLTSGETGFVIAADHGVMIAGAPAAVTSAGQVNRGAAFIFYQDQGGADEWQLKRALAPSQLANGHRFGAAVSLYGDTAVVGSPGADGGHGLAFVFYRHSGGADQWGEVRRISPPTANQFGAFGFAVAVDRHQAWIAIGEPFFNLSEGRVHLCFINTGGANFWNVLKTISNPAGTATQLSDRFGAALSLDLPRLVIGAPNAEGMNRLGTITVANAGRAYVHEIDSGGVNNWGLEDAIQLSETATPNGIAGGLFGTSVALENDKVVIGSPGEASGRGAVYVHERNQGGANEWERVVRLADANGAAGDGFGSAVALKKGRLAAGVPNSDAAGDGSGLVAVFRQNRGGLEAWGLEARLTNGLQDGHLGAGVALDGGFLFAGAPGARTVAVWREEEEGPSLEPEVVGLIPGAGTAQDVAMDGDTIAVSFTGSTPADFRAVMLQRNLTPGESWSAVAALTSPEPTVHTGFGVALDVSGDTAIFGAIGPDVGGRNGILAMRDLRGAAFIHRRNQGGPNNWGLVKKIISPAAGIGDCFGYRVALDGEVAVVGAPFLEGSGSGVGDEDGEAYIYERNSGGTDAWGITRTCDEYDQAFGSSVDVSGNLVHVQSRNEKSFIYARNGGGAGNWGVTREINIGSNDTLLAQAAVMDGQTLVQFSQGYNVFNFNETANLLVREADAGGTNLYGLTRTLLQEPAGTSFQRLRDAALDGDTLVVIDEEFQDLRRFQRNVGGLNHWGEVPSGIAIGHSRPRVAISGTTVAIIDDPAELNSRSLRVFDISLPAWDQWLREVFGEAVVADVTKEATHWGDLADADGDGLATIEEAFFGRDPLRKDAGAAALEPVPNTGTDFTVEWRQGAATFGVIAQPQWSLDLQTWYASGEGPIATPGGGGGTRTITVTPAPASASHDGRIAMRARIARRAGDREMFLRLALHRE